MNEQLTRQDLKADTRTQEQDQTGKHMQEHRTHEHDMPLNLISLYARSMEHRSQNYRTKTSVVIHVQVTTLFDDPARSSYSPEISKLL